MESDSDSLNTASDGGEEEEEDDSGDLSHLGAAANVKFQTAKQKSFQRVERGSERLLEHILETCQTSNRELVPTSRAQEIAETTGSSTTVTQQNVILLHQQFGDVTVKGTRNLTIGGTQNIGKPEPSMEPQEGNNGKSLTPAEIILMTQQNVILLHQQFGDVTVKGTRNLTIGGTQNIGKPEPSMEPQEGNNGKSLTPAEIILNRTISRIESWVKGMVTTSALADLLKKLNKGTKWLTIKGSPGEGKTTVAFMALAELHKSGRQVFHVTSPKEFSEVTATCSQTVIMLDDIFGNLEFDQAEWLKWKPVLHQILDEKEHRSNEQGHSSSMKDVSVILVGRDYVLNSAFSDMGRLADFFTQEAYVVNMSHTVERTVQEKISIWKTVSQYSDINLDENTIDTVCRVRCPHGFPHVCRLFVTMRKKDPNIPAESFFKTPLEFLNQTMNKLIQNKSKLTLFKEMIKGDGKVSVRELGKSDNGSETIQTALDLVGTYLKKEDDYFLFDHPSIYDSVAYKLCSLYPLFVIENCNLSFIHERLRLQPSRDTHHDAPKIESGLVVNIPRAYQNDLAKRFATELSNRNLLQILSHTALRDDKFVKVMMSQVQLPFSTLLKLTDARTGETFLYYIGSSKSPQLLKYIDDHTDIQLSDIDTVLYGVCKFAASDVLTYLSNIRATLDINVRYGYLKQTPLMIAAETRDSQFVNHVMSLNPDLSARDEYDTTAFHYMCDNGLVSAVRLMIDRGTDIDVENSMRRTPLWYACRGNQVEVVRLLLDRGASMDAYTVQLACRKRSVETVSLLVERGLAVNKTSHVTTPLEIACSTGNIEVIKYLIDKGASVNLEGYQFPLQAACDNNKPEVVRYLLEQGANTDSKDFIGYTPLHEAAGSGSKECVDVLLKADIDVNVRSKYGNTPLHKAAESGSKECVDMLLKAGSDLNVQGINGYTPLHEAAKKGSKECVGVLLEAGIDVNVESEDGYTPLHKAAGSGSKECVDMLLKAGIDVNVQGKDGYTPLHKAAGSGSKECVDMLLKAGSDLNVQGKDGYTPLHKAAEKGSKECVDMLLKAGIDVNVQGKDGYTPLHKAAGSGSKECVDMLLKAGSDLNVQGKDGYTPLHKAAGSGSRECVDTLLKAGIDVNVQGKNGNTPLHTAAESGSKECVDMLLKVGIDVNVESKDGNTPLHKAAGSGSSECVDMLLKAGIDVNVQGEDGYTALHIAGKRGAKECVDMLLKAGIDVNVESKDGNTPLHTAAGSGSRACVDMLLKADIDVNVQGKDGNTPLHKAAERGSRECVDMLLKAGIDVNVQGEDGYTALQTAAKRGSKECVDMLLKAGIDVNVQGEDGYTALHIAGKRGARECVDLLLKAGIDVNVQGKDGNTALHKAAESGSRECVDMLLKAGIDVNVQGEDGYTALQTAAKRGSKECVDMLLKAGSM